MDPFLEDMKRQRELGLEALNRTGSTPSWSPALGAHPVYVHVSETGTTLEDARHLRGRTTRETVEAIQAAETPEADALAIGPAGEHHLRFACLAHYRRPATAAGHVLKLVRGAGLPGAFRGSAFVRRASREGR